MSTDVTSPAWKTKLGNGPAKAILVLLADAASSEGLGWPQTPTVCDRTELSERQVLRVLQCFQEIGLVRKVKVPWRGKIVTGWQLNLTLLGGDLRVSFRAAFLKAQGKSTGVSETVNLPVSETAETVSETPFTVSETVALYRRTVKEPSENHHPLPPPAGVAGWNRSLDLAVDQVMAGCGFGRRRLRPVLRAAIERRCDVGEQAPSVALAMIAAWKRQQESADFLRARPSAEKFFGEGYWNHEELWHWDVQKLEMQRQAGTGMR